MVKYNVNVYVIFWKSGVRYGKGGYFRYGWTSSRYRKAAGAVLAGGGAGSGLSDDDFKNTIRNGISKVNIFTDLCLAGERAYKDGEEKKLGYLETRNLKVDYIKEAVKHKMTLFGSVNKA